MRQPDAAAEGTRSSHPEEHDWPKSEDSPKPHGDKLKHAVRNAAEDSETVSDEP
jgi:hypothetical protein